MNLKLGNFSYKTAGRGSESLIVKNGGFKYKDNLGDNSYDDKGVFISNNDYLFIDGKKTFEFSASDVPKILNTNLTLNNMSKDEVDLFIFSQTNKFMLDYIRRKYKIDKEKFYVNMKDVGNTVSNTIPIAINYAINEGKLIKSQKIVLCGFGVGLSMGVVIVEIN